jgi:uncharacterized membrane protein
MVLHHAMYDAVYTLGGAEWLYWNPVIAVLHYIFAGVFIALAGMSSRLSRSNWRRGGMCAMAAAAVSFVTALAGDPVRFGVLHLLASCMLLYALGEELSGRLKRKKTAGSGAAALSYALTAALVAFSAFAVNKLDYEFPFSYVLGWTGNGFYSADHFPLLPWAFVFAFGAVFGGAVKRGSLPERLQTLRIPLFPAIGRHSMVIYLIHQPILYGIALLISARR